MKTAARLIADGAGQRIGGAEYGGGTCGY